MKKIIIVGGNGFIGWPLAVHLAAAGHEIMVLDDLSKIFTQKKLSIKGLVPVKSIHERLAYTDKIGMNISFCDMRAGESTKRLTEVIKKFNPDTIVHMGEIKSAPFSMRSLEESEYTVENNVLATNSVCLAVAKTNPEIHIVHIGTMGVYGYKDELGKIPDGYLDVIVKSTNKESSILFPNDPGSIYHMTKSMDQNIFHFYNKNWSIPITDLHQGIVWGAGTDQSLSDEFFYTDFDYDEIYGTVLNRFIVQSVVGHPLTVHGTGGQTRAFIHLSDSINCIDIAINNPPEGKDRVRILNQISETQSVLSLANTVSFITGCDIGHQENPRNEAQSNNLQVSNDGLVSLGFKPTLISDHLIQDVLFLAEKYKDNVNKSLIKAVIPWK